MLTVLFRLFHIQNSIFCLPEPNCESELRTKIKHLCIFSNTVSNISYEKKQFSSFFDIIGIDGLTFVIQIYLKRLLFTTVCKQLVAKLYFRTLLLFKLGLIFFSKLRFKIPDAESKAVTCN